MKIVILAYDFYIAAIRNLVDQGHEISGIFSFPTDNKIDYNREILSLAAEKRVPTYFHRPRSEDFQHLHESGVQAFLSLAYPYKAPVSEVWRGANLHPTCLPFGRGPWPLTWLILRYPELGGLTLHKHSEAWDAGDIILQRPLMVAPDDTFESLAFRVRLAAVSFLQDALERFDQLWENAVPQGEGSYWPRASSSNQGLRWTDGVEATLRTVRAFGKFGAAASIAGEEYCVMDAQGWNEQHEHSPGSLVTSTNTELLVAVSDGYVLLRQFKKL